MKNDLWKITMTISTSTVRDLMITFSLPKEDAESIGLNDISLLIRSSLSRFISPENAVMIKNEFEKYITVSKFRFSKRFKFGNNTCVLLSGRLTK